MAGYSKSEAVPALRGLIIYPRPAKNMTHRLLVYPFQVNKGPSLIQDKLVLLLMLIGRLKTSYLVMVLLEA